MFKNWFRSANEKRMEEQIVKLREDIVVLQTKIIVLEKQLEVKTTVEDNVVIPNIEELGDKLPLPNNNQEEFIKKVLEEVVTGVEEKVLEPAIVVEEKVLEPAIVVEEKVLEQVVTVEKETNTVPPKKRRQSKKAAQLEEALPKLAV